MISFFLLKTFNLSWPWHSQCGTVELRPIPAGVCNNPQGCSCPLVHYPSRCPNQTLVSPHAGKVGGWGRYEHLLPDPHVILPLTELPSQTNTRSTYPIFGLACLAIWSMQRLNHAKSEFVLLSFCPKFCKMFQTSVPPQLQLVVSSGCSWCLTSRGSSTYCSICCCIWELTAREAVFCGWS